MDTNGVLKINKSMVYSYLYILTVAVFFASCKGEVKKKQTSDNPIVETASDTESKFVKSVQFVTPTKNDTCLFNQDLLIKYSHNKRFTVDSAQLFLNQELIATLDSNTMEYLYRVPETKCGQNTLKIIAYHPKNKQGVATLSIVIKPDKEPVKLRYEIVKKYTHASDASTQGLVYENGFMYESTGVRGKSTLRKIDLEQDKTLSVLSLDNVYFGEGLTIYNNKLYQLTWTSHKGFVYDINTFSLESTFTYSTQGWGLTTMGDRLVMSDGSEKLYEINPNTFQIVKTYQVFDNKGPVLQLNELEYIDGYIWANVWLTDKIVVINPNNGVVEKELWLPNMLTPAQYARLDANDDVLNGIAYNPEKKTIYVTGKHWPVLFELKVIEP